MGRSKKTDSVPRTALIISREAFKSKLIEQITKGKQFDSTNIQTEEQLNSLYREFGLWDDYSEEFLKSAFNNPQNEYTKNLIAAIPKGDMAGRKNGNS